MKNGCFPANNNGGNEGSGQINKPDLIRKPQNNSETLQTTKH